MWTATQREFMLWLAIPRGLSDIRNERAYSKTHTVSRSTLWEWKKLPGFWAEVQEMTTHYLSDAVPDGLQALKAAVRRGSFPHLKLYFEMVGLYVQKIAPTTPDGKRPYAGHSDERLQQAIEREIADLVAARTVDHAREPAE